MYCFYYLPNNLSNTTTINANMPITMVVITKVGIALIVSNIKAITNIKKTIKLITPII